MKLYEHILNMNEKPSTFAKRLNLPATTVTRYLRGERGLSADTIKIILDDAGGALALDDLVPNPYKRIPATSTPETSPGEPGSPRLCAG